MDISKNHLVRASKTLCHQDHSAPTYSPSPKIDAFFKVSRNFQKTKKILFKKNTEYLLSKVYNFLINRNLSSESEQANRSNRSPPLKMHFIMYIRKAVKVFLLSFLTHEMAGGNRQKKPT